MNTKLLRGSLSQLLLLSAMFAFRPVLSQAPFLRTGQVFQILRSANELQEFVVQPGYNSINTLSIGALPNGGFDAMGFRRTDNLLYGIATANNNLYKVGQNAVAQNLGPVGLDNALYYLAGDVTPDGRYLVTVGSDAAGNDIHLARTDLETAGFPTQIISLNFAGHLSDIAFDPTNGTLYGYDGNNTRLVKINTTSGQVVALQALEGGNTVYGLYFDAFGDLYGVGKTLYGIVDGYFQFDKNTGKEYRWTTGPTTEAADLASCPYSIEMKNHADPGINLPCSDIVFHYTLVNGSEETLPGLEFLHPLPPGFHFSSVLQNTFGALVDTLSVPGSLRMQNITLTPGVRTLQIKMSVGDIPKGKYNSQAELKYLPPLYGEKCLSDYTKEPGFEDSTAFVVNRFDEDSLGFTWLICHGETLVLESAEFGNSVLWNTGSAITNLPVVQGGVYSFVAGSSCEKIVVNHEVTSTSCPFTISAGLLFEPDTSFACSDLILRFILTNDSGEPRPGLGIIDSLPPGFSVVGLGDNPFGGSLKPNMPPNVICIEGMILKEGKDTLDVRVHVDDVLPGVYKTAAVLFGLPVVMGPIRFSDNPRTNAVDSSTVYIQGALSDSLFLEQVICENTSITLDASAFGKTFLWDDGSTAPQLLVDEPGGYHLTLFDGCEPADIFWDVLPGPPISLEPAGPYQIHQGESIPLNLQITNAGDSLFIQWSDPLGSSLSCQTCPDPTATPLEPTEYGIRIANEVCFDSTVIVIDVDQTRRVFAPNAFSPNDDGENDEFYLQSPDFGIVQTLNIYDRWGSLVFQGKGAMLVDKELFWDGYYQGKPVSPGVFMWWAEIEFVDGKKQVFSGDVTVVR